MSDIPSLAAGVGAYAASDQTRLTVRLIDALISDQRNELEHCGADRVRELQAAIRQLRALRRVMLGEPHADPRT